MCDERSLGYSLRRNFNFTMNKDGYRELSDENSPLPLFHLPFRHLAVVTVSLPLLGFIFCTAWSLIFEFERSTATHCHVKNYLPSISASIGGYTPQLYVWRVCIGLHSAPRFLVACMYGKYYKNLLVDEPFWQKVAVGLGALHCLENSCLVGLTYVSSTDYYPAHEKFFVAFVTFAFLYMLLSSTVPRVASKQALNKEVLREVTRILYVKLLLTMAFFMGAALAVYFYIRHNRHCEPGMYTVFAVCEYVVVLSNMAFHMCAYWDFGDQILTISGLRQRIKPSAQRGIHQL